MRLNLSKAAAQEKPCVHKPGSGVTATEWPPEGDEDTHRENLAQGEGGRGTRLCCGREDRPWAEGPP